MKKIGIKLADGSFYPILDEGTPKKRMLDLTTVKDNQTKVQVDLYRSELGSMEDAEYVDTLEVTNILPHPNGEPELHLSVGLDDNNELTAEVVDPETGTKSEVQVQLVSRTLAERDSEPDNASVSISEANQPAAEEAASDFSFDDFELPSDTETVSQDDTAEETPAETETSEPALEDVEVKDPTDLDPVIPEEINTADIPFSFDSEMEAAESMDASEFSEPATTEEASVDSILNQVEETAPAETSEEVPVVEENVFDMPETENSLAEEPVLEENSFEDITVPVPEESSAEDAGESAESASESSADFSFDDIPVEEYTPEPAAEESAAVEESAVEETVAEESPVEESAFEAPAEPALEESAAEETAFDAQEPSESIEETLADLPDFESTETAETTENIEETSFNDAAAEISAEEPAFDEPAAEPSFEEPAAESADSSDSALDETLADIPDFGSSEISSEEMPDFNEPVIEDTALNESPAEETSTEDFSVDTLDLPDFDNLDSSSEATAETSVTEEPSPSTDDMFNAEDFSMPDFDEPAADSSSSAETEGLTGYFDDPTFNDPVFNDDSTGADAASSSMDFSNLYDNETIAGEHATPYIDEEEGEKKTKLSVIICIICAIICLIATGLILFIIPSKYNLLNKKTVTEVTIEEEVNDNELPPPPPLEEKELVTAPAAEEDKIVIAPQPEIVVPVPTPAPSEKKEDIRYKIKWGDTLWDISDTYYKTPWRYKNIADYNKIKNPDVIISGTYINIPAEN